MSLRRMRLALRRERLIERSRMLRRETAERAHALDPLLDAGDRVRDGVAWCRRHPGVLAAAVIGFALIRPRRAWRWGMRLWGVSQLFASLRHRLHMD